MSGKEGQNAAVSPRWKFRERAKPDLAESDRAEAILAAAKARRLLVLDALVTLENGSYGVCVDCGKPVPEGRLEVKPEAARCLACQAKRDGRDRLRR